MDHRNQSLMLRIEAPQDAGSHGSVVLWDWGVAPIRLLGHVPPRPVYTPMCRCLVLAVNLKHFSQSRINYYHHHVVILANFCIKELTFVWYYATCLNLNKVQLNCLLITSMKRINKSSEQCVLVHYCSLIHVARDGTNWWSRFLIRSLISYTSAVASSLQCATLPPSSSSQLCARSMRLR